MNKKNIKHIFLLVILIFIVSACGASNNSYTSESSYMKENINLNDSEFYMASVQDNIEKNAKSDNEVQEEKKKKIKNASLSIETNLFDSDVESIKSLANNYGGYVQSFSSHVYTTRKDRKLKDGEITIRIPADRYEEMMENIKNIAKVTSITENVEDVSQQYFDIEARLNIKKGQEDSILKMIGKAEAIEDLIELEKNLSETRATIELYQSQLNNIDSLVDYSTITISITEKYEEVINNISNDLLSKMGDSVKQSINLIIDVFEAVLVIVAGLLVPVSILCLIVYLIKFIHRAIKKKINKKENK